MEAYMQWVWVGVLTLFVITEATTSALVALWFIGGSFVALLLAMFGLPVWLQCVSFVLVSFVLLLYLRPRMKKCVDAKKTATNAESLVGRIVPVTEPIDNLHGKGAVRVSGVEWTAFSEDGRSIAADTAVRIISVNGAKLCVKTAEKA